MSYNYSIPASLLRFLGACIYGDAGSYYADLSEAERAELEKQGRIFGMTTWFYRYLYEVLPEEKRAAYQKIYQSRKMKAIMGEQELSRLYKVLAAHELGFVPVKGADLAYRLYPDAALRSYRDWDIWFHPDDCERALAVLAEDGWKVPESYSENHEAVRSRGVAHHFSPHVRGQYKIEPHFKLANFEGIDLYEMWENTVEYPAGEGQRVLSPEMNLLMLARHAATKSYYHAQIPKLLTDAAIVLKENVDFAALRELGVRWHLPDPCDLFAAFPEFFPEEMIRAFGADQEKTNKFRRLFELRGKLDEPESIALMLSRYEAQGQIKESLMNHIRALTPDKIRLIYRLPNKGAWHRVLWGYLCWFWNRTRRTIAWIHRKRQLKDYCQLVEVIETDSSEP